MNKSESIAALAAALSKAQGVIKGAVKDSSNPFFKSKYADLSSVVEAIRAAFSSNGLSYIQTVEPSVEDEVRVETMILHSSGEWISCGVLALPVSKSDAQGFGSALTYARRYSLSAAAGVAPEDDDGNAAAKAPASAKSVSQADFDTLTPERQAELQTVADCVMAEHNQKGSEAALALLREETKDWDATLKVALNSRFDAPTRRALKEAGQPRKAT